MIFEVVIVGLATWQAVEVYHHGSIFADTRARFEAKGGFFADLLACPFCLSVWVGVLFAGMYMSDYVWLVSPVVGLAASRLANLCNDLSRSYNRTPKGPESEEHVEQQVDST